MKEMLYQETTTIKAIWLRAVLWGLICTTTFLFGFFIFLIPSLGVPAVIIVILLGIGCILLLFAAVNYHSLEIQITGDTLTVGYRFMTRKQIRLSDIQRCDITQATVNQYGGLGARYRRPNTWAYLTSFGDAVKIISNDGTTFIFSSQNPQHLCQIIHDTKKRELS